MFEKWILWLYFFNFGFIVLGVYTVIWVSYLPEFFVYTFIWLCLHLYAGSLVVCANILIECSNNFKDKWNIRFLNNFIFCAELAVFFLLPLYLLWVYAFLLSWWFRERNPFFKEFLVCDSSHHWWIAICKLGLLVRWTIFLLLFRSSP